VIQLCFLVTVVVYPEAVEFNCQYSCLFITATNRMLCLADTRDKNSIMSEITIGRTSSKIKFDFV